MKHIIMTVATIMVLALASFSSHAQDKGSDILFTTEPGFMEGLLAYSTVRGPLEASLMDTRLNVNGVKALPLSDGRTNPRWTAVSPTAMKYLDDHTPISEAAPFFLLGLGLIGLGSMGRQFIR